MSLLQNDKFQIGIQQLTLIYANIFDEQQQ